MRALESAWAWLHVVKLTCCCVRARLCSGRAAIPTGASIALVSYSQTAIAVHDLGNSNVAHVKVIPVVEDPHDLDVALHDVASLAFARRVMVHFRSPWESDALIGPMRAHALAKPTHAPNTHVAGR